MNEGVTKELVLRYREAHAAYYERKCGKDSFLGRRARFESDMFHDFADEDIHKTGKPYWSFGMEGTPAEALEDAIKYYEK